MKPRGKFIHFAEIAEKWGYSEDELIQLAIQKEELNLYCLKAIPGHPARMPFCIGDELNDFLPRKPRIYCSQFGYKTSDYEEGTFIPLGPDDHILGAIYRANHPELSLERVTVDRADLYLHRDEIALMESSYPKLAETKASIETDPELSGVEARAEAYASEEPNTAKQSDVGNEQLAQKVTSIIRRRTLAEKLQSKNNSGAVSPSSPDFETIATLDNHTMLPEEIDKEVDLSTKAEQQYRIKQPIKKKEIPASCSLATTVEPLILGNDDKEQPPMRQAVPEERLLRLDEIVGNSKKGNRGIVPMSKQTWYKGIKDGRFPPKVDTRGKSSYWKKSDIDALLNGKTDW